MAWKASWSQAPYIDKNKYAAQIAWKRELHETHQTVLVETFHYEHQEGLLLEALEAKLLAQGVTFNPLPEEATLETLREFGAVRAFAILLSDLIPVYKSAWLDENGYRRKIRSAANPSQVEAALKLLAPIFTNYQAYLASRDEIDFDDMIGKAVQYFESGDFKSPWRFILVDEFQDIAEPRARLVRALRDERGECSLFCVGDDWQSIYRFTGADLSLTTAFSEYFGATVTTVLDTTFRFNNSISDTASRFVMTNPAQLKKQIRTIEIVSQPAVSLVRRSQSERLSALFEILSAINDQTPEGTSVYLLGRFWFRLPEKEDISRLARDFPKLKITPLSFHASKGKESDNVVVMGLQSGKHGFPSEKIMHPLLDALLPVSEVFPFAGERRLFYVALTRARQRAYLLCDMVGASSFVYELLEGEYQLELEEFDLPATQRRACLVRCPRCETGTLVAREGKHGAFYACSNYPRCEYSEGGCEQCGKPMGRQGRFKICVDPECSNTVPICPQCGAEMVQRSGRRGLLWGCWNYRGVETPSCRHTEDYIALTG
ncbi:MAG: topoisomerase DNA-binding C4 zinc finger domain-containing protein [Candidatus Thiodiazotropha sp. (ex Notomyrtea botanica)]|nr:topoisomerase DNA-binding C4 zinc finger domain-containing protein [Candidatus Thiodiazotropha sp. (ex Notomyrtea botanica)]